MALLAGIDGGASKSLAMLVDGEGRVLARLKGPGIAMLGAPSAAQRETVRSLLAGLMEGAGAAQARPDFLALGLNGVDFEDEFDAQKAALAEAAGLPLDRLAMANDGVAALWGASPRPQAAILQHGSAVTAAYRPALGQERPFDHLDVGGIFDLRQEAIKAARRMLDGRLQPTPLLGRIEAHLGVKGRRAFSDAAFRRRLSSEAVSRLHLVVFEAWQAGDAVAADLVKKAAADYAASARAMAALSGAREIHVGGGLVTTAPPAFWEELRGAMARALPGASIAPPAMGPDCGACLMAGFHAGTDHAKLWEGLMAGRKVGA